MKKLTKIYVDDLDLQTGLVDITDPCYDADVWCRTNNIKVVPGIYECNAHKSKNNRIMMLDIYLKDDPETIKKIKKGTSWRKTRMSIGVDAGLAGFFQSPKPDFDNNDWTILCNYMAAKNNEYDAQTYSSTEVDCSKPFNGVWSESGYGDGVYPVHAIKNNKGQITALQIRF